MNNDFQYFAFISYKREDEKWAKWLHQKLEHYRLPTLIQHKQPDIPHRIKPVFRDTTDIKPGVLTDVLTQNLANSKYLIVICSPRSAQSQWVGKEITDFIALGREKNIILFIIDGEPYSNNPKTECYHAVIKEKLPEMLGVNINEKSKDWKFIKKQKAFIRVVATLLGVTFDSLWLRQRRRIIKKALLNTALILFFIITISSVSYYQYKKNQAFDVKIKLKEITYHNKNLPFENGKIYLCYDNDTLVSKPINNYSDIVEFKNIPGEYKGKKAKVWFEMFGFEKKDSTIFLNSNNMIKISRDNSFSYSFGTVLEASNYKPLKDVNIIINQFNTYTNDAGYFEFIFKPEQQVNKFTIYAIKQGYQIFKCTGSPSPNTKWEILLLKK